MKYGDERGKSYPRPSKFALLDLLVATVPFSQKATFLSCILCLSFGIITHAVMPSPFWPNSVTFGHERRLTSSGTFFHPLFYTWCFLCYWTQKHFCSLQNKTGNSDIYTLFQCMQSITQRSWFNLVWGSASISEKIMLFFFAFVTCITLNFLSLSFET